MIRKIRSLITSVNPVVAAIVATTGCGMLTGCGYETLPAYSAFVDIDPALWAPGNPAELSPRPRDSVRSTERFDLDLAVRHNKSAPDSLRLVVSTEAFDIPLRNDTITMIVRQYPDRPEGIGGFGIFTLTSNLSSNDTVPDGMRIAVEPLVPVKGIISVGLVLTPHRSH